MRYTALLAAFFVLLTGCDTAPESGPDVETEGTAYIGATVWSDGQAIPNAALIVQDGRVVLLDSLATTAITDEMDLVDLSGHYIVPGLINAHGHVGIADGLDTGGAAHSEENVREQLSLYATYGVTTVVSLGDEPEEAFTVRDLMDPADPGMARLRLAGPVLSPASEDDARETVLDLLDLQPDWAKIRVDDQLGRGEKMSPDVYGAIIDAADEANLPLAAHIVELEDAKGVLEAGADLIAHSVRDTEVDEAFIEQMRETGVCLTPTLTREVSTYIYAERPDFFDDAFFRAHADEDVLEQLQESDVQERFTGEAADYYREQLPVAKENMMTLHEEGVTIAMGTDSGPPARFQGYFEHKEMRMMQEAGMAPEDILQSATAHAADCTNLEDLGRLAEGAWADFVVLREDPTEDIHHLEEIEAVYISGTPVE